MKSYSVKSNAKRFARGVAAKYPGVYEPAEPVETSIEGMGWFPALAIVGEKMPDSASEVRATCIITNPPVMFGVMFDRQSAENAVVIDDTVAAPAPVEVDVRDFGARGSIFDQQMGRAAREMPKDVPPILDYAAMAKELPPPVTSSAEDIAARRAERRQKIDADKAAGTFGVKAEKISKKKILLDLMRREEGASQAELEAAVGWQRHTLRGYIAGTLRKILAPIGKEIECQRGGHGVATRYFIVDAKKVGA